MLKKKNRQDSSKTALLAAFHRALANLEFDDGIHGPDHLSCFFLPSFKRFLLNFKFIRTMVKSKLDKIIPGMDELMIARTAFYDGLFKDALNNNFPQIVLMGAGYDTRAIRFAGLNNTTKIIELDILPTQSNKKKCLAKAKIILPEQVTFAPVDFNKESIPHALEKAGYDSHQKTLFIWEGVTMYLEPVSVDSTLEVITQFANPDSIIAFDYLVTVPVGEISDWYGVKELFQIMKKQYGDEKFIFSIDKGEIRSFLEQRGLKVIEDLDNNDLENRFLTREDGSLIGKMMAAYCVVSAMPK